MAKRKSPLQPLGVRKQEELIRLLNNAIESARLTNADFGEICATGSFPTQERQVTKFIRERTRLYRETWILAPLQKCLSVINEASRQEKQ